jgi:hypothetical protein
MATTGQKVAYAAGAALGVASLVGLVFYLSEKSDEEQAPAPPEKKPGIWVSDQTTTENQTASQEAPPPEFVPAKLAPDQSAQFTPFQL